MELELSKTFTFEASHLLSRHPGKCSRLHGHSWVLKVSVKGKVNPQTGFVMDYVDIKKAVQPIIDDLDHRHLGEWDGLGWEIAMEIDVRVPYLPDGFYPSSENLIVWIGGRLASLEWSKLELNETCTSSCVLTREEYNARR